MTCIVHTLRGLESYRLSCLHLLPDVKRSSQCFHVRGTVRQLSNGQETSGEHIWISAQGRTAFSYVSDAAELLAAHSIFQQSHHGRTDPPAGVLCLLQGLLASVIEVLHLRNTDLTLKVVLGRCKNTSGGYEETDQCQLMAAACRVVLAERQGYLQELSCVCWAGAGRH